MWRLVITLWLFAAVQGAAAQDCPKPAPPACAFARVPFADEGDFDGCRKEMVAFRDAIDQQATCLAPKSPEAEKAARDAFEEVRVRFNKRARGEMD